MARLRTVVLKFDKSGELSLEIEIRVQYIEPLFPNITRRMPMRIDL